jgi:hypothetical protein
MSISPKGHVGPPGVLTCQFRDKTPRFAVDIQQRTSIVRISGLIAAATIGLILPLSSAFADGTQPNADLDKIVCRAGEPVTGTRLGGPRVCHTQREWDQIQRDAQDSLSGVQQKSAQGNMPGG